MNKKYMVGRRRGHKKWGSHSSHSSHDSYDGHVVCWKKSGGCNKKEKTLKATYYPAMGDRGYLGKFHASNFDFGKKMHKKDNYKPKP